MVRRLWDACGRAASRVQVVGPRCGEGGGEGGGHCKVHMQRRMGQRSLFPVAAELQSVVSPLHIRNYEDQRTLNPL